MIILGLTGGIGMGKSTVARQIRALGIPVHDADAAVHRLLGESGGAVAAVAEMFGAEVKKGKAIDRKKLGVIVFNDPEALKRLESIMHPLVHKEEKRFLKKHTLRKTQLVVLEIPLLFETGAEKRCDKVIVVTADRRAQRRRVKARQDMNDEKFRAILARQTPDVEKRARADYIIYTGLGKAYSMRMVKKLMKRLRGKTCAK